VAPGGLLAGKGAAGFPNVMRQSGKIDTQGTGKDAKKPPRRPFVRGVPSMLCTSRAGPGCSQSEVTGPWPGRGDGGKGPEGGEGPFSSISREHPTPGAARPAPTESAAKVPFVARAGVEHEEGRGPKALLFSRYLARAGGAAGVPREAPVRARENRLLKVRRNNPM
jgi:hypothetical protein